MEVVYSTNFKDKFPDHVINTFYGDAFDLINLGIDVEGIIYDDEWTVKKFLKYFKNKKRIISIFNYLDINEELLNIKIKDLSKTDFKWILLAYMLLLNNKYLIFDYFDTSLIYKDKKKLVKVIRKLVNDDINIIVVSKDLVFLNNLNSKINLLIDDGVLYNASIIDLVTNNSKLVEIPLIVEFINMANKKGANLDMTLDSKELLKNIYREVK